MSVTIIFKKILINDDGTIMLWKESFSCNGTECVCFLNALVINIKCQQHDKQVHHFSLARHSRYDLEDRDTAAAVCLCDDRISEDV